MKLRKRHTRSSIINEPKKPSIDDTFIDNIIFKEEDTDIKISPTQAQDPFIPMQKIANNPNANESLTKEESTLKSLVKSEDILIEIPGT